MTSARSQDHRAAVGLVGILCVVTAGVVAMASSSYPGAPIPLRLALGFVGGALCIGGVWAATEVVA